MLVVKMKRGTLTLPVEAAGLIGADAQFTVITTGDTIILKKITLPRLSEIAGRAPKDKPMTLSEIAQEVHRYRRSRRAHRR
jgi:hypothetical protein